MIVYHRIMKYEVLRYLQRHLPAPLAISILDYDVVMDTNWLSVREHFPSLRIFFDRAVFEKIEVSTDQYLRWVEVLKPDCWVLPDVIDSLEDTIRLLGEYSSQISTLKHRGQRVLVLASVPTDMSIDEKIRKFIQDFRITHIGIPYRSGPTPTSFYNRLEAMWYADHLRLRKHWLGLERITELGCIFLTNGSLDTNLCLASTLEGFRISEHYSKIAIPEKVERIDVDLLRENILLLENYINSLRRKYGSTPYTRRKFYKGRRPYRRGVRVS